MQANSGLICSFSPGGDALAIATDDGRVRTYDTATGRLRATLGLGTSSLPGPNASIANGFLTEKHTCLAWVGRKDKLKKKQEGSQAASLVVLGTAAGDIKAYDAQLGELKWRCKNAIEGGVAALTFSSANGGVIYATGAAKQIVALNASHGEIQSRFEASNHALSCLILSPDHATAFGGGSGLALWDLASQEKSAKFTGHPSPARSAAFAPDGRHAVSAAEGERHIAVWSTVPPPAKRAKKSQSAVASLSLEDPALLLDTCQQGQTAGSFHVAAVSEAGDAYVWTCQEQGAEGQLQTRLLARVRVGGAATKGAAAGAEESIMAVKLQPGTEGPCLLVARGSSAKPVFEKVQVPVESTTDGVAPIISLQPAAGGLLMDGPSSSAKEGAKPKASHARADVTVLGPENLGQPVMMRVGIKGDAGLDAGGRKRPEPEPEAALDEDEVPDLPEDEVPLGQRVARMEERANMPGSGDAAGEEEQAGPSGQQLPQGSSKADSLAVLLTQALRSNDRALLEKCLSTNNVRIINNTVRRLIPMDAVLFLRAAVDRVMSKPARAAQLAPWIKAVMHYHTGYLMTAPAVQGPLAALYQAIDNRVGLYQQLLKLYGRLSLITAHTSQAAGQSGDGADDEGLPGPEMVFEDGSDDEPEAEDPFAPDGLDEDDDDEDDGEDEDEENGGGADDMSEQEDGDDDDDLDADDDEDDE